ncbi:GxxExxY protein [Sodaliphilus sp.]|uniref:GxxExxY protein n=1 Tax=Sodaliphilus sp. TaxID=2815818 RepID=UPI00388E0ED9
MITTITRKEYMQMYGIIGAALEVHNNLKRGLEEAIYQEALEMELSDREISFETQKVLNTYYKDRKLKKIYQADLYSNGVMIELKSVSQLNSEHRAQLINYMRITKTNRGLLINFGEKSLRVERYIYQQDKDDFILLSKKNLKLYVSDN